MMRYEKQKCRIASLVEAARIIMEKEKVDAMKMNSRNTVLRHHQHEDKKQKHCIASLLMKEGNDEEEGADDEEEEEAEEYQ